MTFDKDSKAVTAAQKAILGAGYSGPVAVNGTYDAATQAGAAWLWTQGSSTPFSGHLDSAFFDALGINTASFQPDPPPPEAAPPPPPPPPPSKAKPIAILATIGAGIAIGATFGGPLGAAIGGVAGVVAGMVIGRASS